MPLFNWQALKSNQVVGTIFSELDEEHIYEVCRRDLALSLQSIHFYINSLTCAFVYKLCLISPIGLFCCSPQ